MSTTTATARRTERLNIRSSERQANLLKRAAASADMTMSDFILNSAVKEAERLLADQRWFMVSNEQYDDFIEALDRPVSQEAVRKLFTAPTPFGRDFPSERE